MRTFIRQRIATILFAVLIGSAALADGAVDANIVGTWQLQTKGGGLWVWEIHSDGTYAFHSEAGDGVPPHSGTFTASKGRWKLKATTGWADLGVYVFQPPDTLIATGLLGTAAWRRQAAQVDAHKADAPKPDAPKPPLNGLGVPQDF
jgi:hypothetical protein